MMLHPDDGFIFLQLRKMFAVIAERAGTYAYTIEVRARCVQCTLCTEVWLMSNVPWADVRGAMSC